MMTIPGRLGRKIKSNRKRKCEGEEVGKYTDLTDRERQRKRERYNRLKGRINSKRDIESVCL